MRLVVAVLRNLEICDADPETIEIVRGPVLRASARAGRRFQVGAGATAKADTTATEGAAPPLR